MTLDQIAHAIDKLVKSVVVKENTQGGMTYVTLESGSLAGLEIRQQSYLSDYNPMGYNTTFRAVKFNEALRTWSVSGSRFSSCN